MRLHDHGVQLAAQVVRGREVQLAADDERPSRRAFDTLVGRARFRHLVLRGAHTVIWADRH